TFSRSSLESFKCSLANFRQPCTCASFSRGILRELRDFKPLWRKVLPMVFLVTGVPAALRSFTSSPCVVLGLFCTFRYRTRGYLAWSPRPRAIDSCLVLLPFTNNRTNSCLLLTKLLADGCVTHSSLVQVYNLITDVLGQLFGLAHGGEVEGVKYDSLDRFLLYTSPVEIRCTLLGLMRTNMCASWAHNWSLGARILAVCLGVQILIFCIKYK